MGRMGYLGRGFTGKREAINHRPGFRPKGTTMTNTVIRNPLASKLGLHRTPPIVAQTLSTTTWGLIKALSFRVPLGGMFGRALPKRGNAKQS